MRRSADVAVVGAGAAGLAAVRELVREGHRVTCYEVGCFLSNGSSTLVHHGFGFCSLICDALGNTQHR